MKTAADVEREAIENGLTQLRNNWTPDEIVCALIDATVTIQDARVFCDGCGEEITGDPVRDPEEASWLPAGGQRFCCQWCLAVREARAVDADGNQP